MLTISLLCFYNGSPGLFKNYMKLYKKPTPHDSWGNFLFFSKSLAMQHICRHRYMIKLIKITIKEALTTDSTT